MTYIENPIRKALEILAERGWTKGLAEDPITGQVCARGAINLAVFGSSKLNRIHLEGCQKRLQNKAWQILTDVWKEQYHALDSILIDLIDFNDSSYSTIDDMVLIFEKGALRWDELVFANEIDDLSKIDTDEETVIG